MFCSNCGNKLNKNENFCSNCGTSRALIPINNAENLTMSEKLLSQTSGFLKPFMSKIKKYKKIWLSILIVMTILIIGIVVYNSITNYFYEKNIHYIFKVNGKEIKIGEKVSYYEKKGYTYKDEYYKESDIIVADGFIPHSFYVNNNPVMYAAIHCKQEETCTYSDGNIVKINFYDSIGEVILSDFIKLGTTYDEIVSRLGEPDGKFYMNSDEYVWSFYEKGKIDNPYYVLEFDGSKKVIGMKIGMWWYEDEYEHTIKK